MMDDVDASLNFENDGQESSSALFHFLSLREDAIFFCSLSGESLTYSFSEES
jgi:hypothetical protein